MEYLQSYLSSVTEQDKVEELFIHQEIKTAIYSFEPNKVPRPDELNPKIIRQI